MTDNEERRFKLTLFCMDSYSKFSDRYGYTTPSSVLRREELYEDDINGICTCYDILEERLHQFDIYSLHTHTESFAKMEEIIWCVFLKKRKKDFWSYNNIHKVVATEFIKNTSTRWYEVFNLIDFTLHCLRSTHPQSIEFQKIVDSFSDSLNKTFLRQDLAYRVVNSQIVEITDKQEIATIEKALTVSVSVNEHLTGALLLLSSRPTPDYRNSIKESISAVEAICRSITGENSLKDALKSLEKKGVVIPNMLKQTYLLLYAYTNDKTTGIRHALIDSTETPGFDEAKFMLVSCSAFINYIEAKKP